MGIENIANNYWIKNYSQLPGWFIRFEQYIPKPHYPDDKDSILYFLSVIASVTGVTLALFYTILATLASTAYAKVQSSIRNLIIYDKDTQEYLRRLTNLTACSITILFSLSLHFYPGNLVLLFLFSYSLSTLFGILKIGMGVYNYFEPSVIARSVISNMSDTIKNVTIKGQYWDDSSFQNHNYNNAFIQTENLKLITDLCIKGDDLKETSFKSIIQASITVMRHYLYQKSKIPRESLWFPEVLEHKSYFESDMSARSLSRNAHTFILPKKTRNTFWFEEKVIGNISLSLETLIKYKFVKVFAESIPMLFPLLKSISYSLDIKTGESLISHIANNLKKVRDSDINDGDLISYEDWIDYLQAIDAYALAIFTFQAGVMKRILKYDVQKITAEYKKIKWGKVNSIYTADFIPELYELLDLLNALIDNEKTVEGKVLTPDWYLKQQIVANHVTLITSKLKPTIQLYNTYFLNLAKFYDQKGNGLLASFLIQKGYEFLDKYQHNLNSLEATIDTLDSFEVLKGEYTWNKPNFQILSELIDEYNEEGLKLLAKNAEKLSVVKWSNRYPDIFSHTYSILNSNINTAFLTNDLNTFKELFAAFLKATVAGYNTLIKNFEDYTHPYRITYQTFIDVMEISGYAYLYAYLYNEPKYWSETLSAWENYFPAIESNIQIVTNSYAIHTQPFSGINFGEKHQRMLAFQNVLRDVNSKNPELIIGVDKYIEPFIQLREFSSFYEVSELFMELYLFSFVEAKSSTTNVKRNLFEHWCHLADGSKYLRYND